MRTNSVNDHRYFLTIVDDHTRHTWVHFMKNKSETRSLVRDFISYVKTQFNCSVKSIRTDNGCEFNMHTYFAEHGILHQTSCVETPQQNSVVERKHRHILNTTRCLFFQSNMPVCYWNYTVAHVVYLINRLPSPFEENKSPYELFFHKLPDLTNLKSFGCLCFNSTISQNGTKLDPRAQKSVFLGFKNNTKGFDVLHLDHRTISVSRNVVFYEPHFPFLSGQPPNVAPDTTDTASTDFFKIFDIPNPMESRIPTVLPSTSQAEDRSPPLQDLNSVSAAPTPLTDDILHDASVSLDIPEPTASQDPNTVQQRKSNRLKSAPSHLLDYHCGLLQGKHPNPDPQVKYPISSYVNYNNLSRDFACFSISISMHEEPKSFKTACEHDHWVKAMNSELDALSKNNT
jgi:hypothetical protein